MLPCFLAVGCGKVAATGNAAPDLTQPTPALPRVTDDLASKSSLDSVDLLRVLAEYSAYKPKDQFSPEFDPSAINGKPVVLSVGPFDPNALASDQALTWRYDINTQTLSVLFRQYGMNWVSEADDYGGIGGTRVKRSIVLKAGVRDTGSYVAQNAFGATRTVQQSLEERTGIAEFEHFRPNESMTPAFLSWDIRLPPDRARSIAPQLRVQVSGRVEPGRKGELVNCVQHSTEATITTPTAVESHECYVAVRIDSIQLVGVPPGVPVVPSHIP